MMPHIIALCVSADGFAPTQVDDYLGRLVRVVPALPDGRLDTREITMCLYGFLLAVRPQPSVSVW